MALTDGPQMTDALSNIMLLLFQVSILPYNHTFLPFVREVNEPLDNLLERLDEFSVSLSNRTTNFKSMKISDKGKRLKTAHKFFASTMKSHLLQEAR